MIARDLIDRWARRTIVRCRDCEPGIMLGQKAESLHQYRVGLRRLRSVIRSVKQVYPSEPTRQLVEDLSGCAKRTNQLRDLDVLLARRHQYASWIPQKFATEFDRLVVDLTSLRDSEHGSVVAHLQTEHYRETIERISEVFERTYPDCKNSHRSTRWLAKRIIGKHSRKLVRMCGGISAASSDNEIHKVRLQVKRIRYLLECFRSGDERNWMLRLQKQMKRLQTAIGDFNDYSVQQCLLESYASGCVSQGEYAPRRILMVGSLIGMLDRKQAESCRLVVEQCHHFATTKTMRRFTAMGR